MIAEWADRYFDAWRTNDPSDVAALFAENAVYFYGPFRPPAEGREEIVRRWIANADQQDVVTTHEVIATNGNTGVVHWTVRFRDGDGRNVALDGILVVTLDGSGRCVEHREWYAVAP
jgi:ketosteroid isomerase-like protein